MEIGILIMFTLMAVFAGKMNIANSGRRYAFVLLLTLLQVAYMLYVVFTMEPPPLRF